MKFTHTHTRSLLYINASDRIDGRLKMSSPSFHFVCIQQIVVCNDFSFIYFFYSFVAPFSFYNNKLRTNSIERNEENKIKNMNFSDTNFFLFPSLQD